jgi:hypothetical protein
MPGPDKTVISRDSSSSGRLGVLSGLWVPDQARLDGVSRSQVSTQAPSWRARPSTSSRRRLTAATRSDHQMSLRSIPR